MDSHAWSASALLISNGELHVIPAGKYPEEQRETIKLELGELDLDVAFPDHFHARNVLTLRVVPRRDA